MAIDARATGIWRNADFRGSMNRRGLTEWFEAVHAVHQRMLQEMDLAAIEKLDRSARARP